MVEKYKLEINPKVINTCMCWNAITPIYLTSFPSAYINTKDLIKRNSFGAWLTLAQNYL